jgi:glutamate formiminotransferase/formiminotetrahydrofolate cyclodeaminase
MPASRFADDSLGAFVDALASAAPVPGGGSASAVAASIAAGLVAMVAALSDRPRYADHAPLHRSVGDQARSLAQRSLELADEDAEAYARYAAALKLPRETEAERAGRDEALALAAKLAAEVPLRTVEVCLSIVGAAESLAGRSNVNASSDLAVAVLLGEAAARGAARNVEVNLPSVRDEAWAAATHEEVTRLLDETARLSAATRDVVARGAERPALVPPAAS